jgi:hypothetical protein
VNGLQLLAEEKLLLTLGELRLDVRLDLLAELEQLEFPRHQRRELLQTFPDALAGEEVLLLLRRDVQVGGDQVGHLPGVDDVGGHDLQLVGKVVNHRNEPAELRDHVGDEGVELGAGHGDVGERLNRRTKVRLALRVGEDLDALHALDEDADAAIRIAERLQHPAGGATRVELVGRGLLDVGVLLRHQPEQPIAGGAIVDQLDGGRARDEQRRDGRREDHDAAQREDRQFAGDGDARCVHVEGEADARLDGRLVVAQGGIVGRGPHGVVRGGDSSLWGRERQAARLDSRWRSR